jgi:hypothetical protein
VWWLPVGSCTEQDAAEEDVLALVTEDVASSATAQGDTTCHVPEDASFNDLAADLAALLGGDAEDDAAEEETTVEVIPSEAEPVPQPELATELRQSSEVDSPGKREAAEVAGAKGNAQAAAAQAAAPPPPSPPPPPPSRACAEARPRQSRRRSEYERGILCMYRRASMLLPPLVLRSNVPGTNAAWMSILMSQTLPRSILKPAWSQR